MKTNVYLQPEIKEIPARIIVGICITTSLSENRTSELWRAFIPRKKDIKNKVTSGSFSIQVYDTDFLTKPFLPTTIFEKWAGVEVRDRSFIPKGMEVMEIPKGKWAVFTYKGRASDFHQFAMYIFEKWLPQSGYQLDVRPHFEYMPPDYLGPTHPEAEEEVWIPIL